MERACPVWLDLDATRFSSLLLQDQKQLLVRNFMCAG